MRKKISLAAAIMLLASFMVFAPTAAQAAPVTFDRAANKTVSSGQTVTIKPLVSRAYGTQITSKSVTVKRNGSVVARNKKSVKLGVGTYRVSTKVKFRVKKNGHWGKKRFAMRTYTLVISAKRVSTGGGSSGGGSNGGTTSRYFKNCTEARNAGAAPVYRGDPGYGRHLDRDGDGVGCE